MCGGYIGREEFGIGMKRLFFGIDGGGTQSRLGICDEENRLLAQVKGGSTNRYAVGFETACANLRELIQKLKTESGIVLQDCAAGCFASAGMSTEEETEDFRRFFTGEGIRYPLYLCNDALAALAGGTGAAEGIIVVSGTGSIAAGLDKTGKTARAGGLGHLIGDEGSGFRIGLDGIKAAAAALERRGKPTVLTSMLFAHYGVKTVRDLFPFLYTNFDKSQVASFSPCVFQAAQQSDAVAAGILATAAQDLSLLARSVYGALFDGSEIELVFSGGILEHQASFAKLTAAYIVDAVPQVRIIRRRFDPVVGACILARSGRM